MKKIGVFGIGAIGSVLIKYLIQNTDNKFYFFNRTQHTSLKVAHSQKEDKILLNLSDIRYYQLDWLIICLKEHQIKEAKIDLQKLIEKQTKLAIFQNGIHLSKPYIELIDKQYILETTIDCPIERINKRYFNQIRSPIITLPISPLADEFINLFSEGEVTFQQTHDFEKNQWIKLIESSTIGSIQSLTEKPCSIFKKASYLEDYKLLIKEGIEVARSESIELEEKLLSQLLSKLMSYPESKGSSMLTDKLNGNILELDAKIGAIINIAIKNKIKIPNTERYYKLLLHYNRSITS